MEPNNLQTQMLLDPKFVDKILTFFKNVDLQIYLIYHLFKTLNQVGIKKLTSSDKSKLEASSSNEDDLKLREEDLRGR